MKYLSVLLLASCFALLVANTLTLAAQDVKKSERVSCKGRVVL